MTSNAELKGLIQGVIMRIEKQNGTLTRHQAEIYGEGDDPGLRGMVLVLQEKADVNARTNKIIIGGIVVIITTLILNFLSGCQDFRLPTPTLIPTAPTVTQAATGGPTRTATATVTSTPTPSATATIPAPGGNLIINGDFETGVRPVIFPEVNVFADWEPWYCDQPYATERCRIPVEWNPYEEFMKRPEYKPVNPYIGDCTSNPYPTRVQEGCNAQQLFAYSAVARAGIFQVVQGLVPGQTYELSAYVQLWTMEGADSDRNPDDEIEDHAKPCVVRNASNICIDWSGDNFTSDRATEDDLQAIRALLGIDQTCGVDAFSDTVDWAEFGSEHQLYDSYGRIAVRFTATGTCVTVFPGGYNRYANAHNNWYIDNVMLVATDVPASTPQPTPTQIVRETPEPTETPTPTGEVGYPRWVETGGVSYRVTVYSLRQRDQPDLGGLVTGGYIQGQVITVWCYYELSENGDTWASEQKCDAPVRTWAALRLGNTDFMELVEGPAGR